MGFRGGFRPAPFFGGTRCEKDISAEANQAKGKDLQEPPAGTEEPHVFEEEQVALVKRVLDYDPWTGTTTFHEYDHDTKTTTLWTEQDASSFLESNRRLANDEDRKKRGIKDCWWHVATIPNGVIDAWMKEGINVFDKNQSKEVARRLNSPEWRYLRTSPGRM